MGLLWLRKRVLWENGGIFKGIKIDAWFHHLALSNWFIKFVYLGYQLENLAYQTDLLSLYLRISNYSVNQLDTLSIQLDICEHLLKDKLT